MKEKLARGIRGLTISPFLAAVMLGILYRRFGAAMGAHSEIIAAMGYLAAVIYGMEKTVSDILMWIFVSYFTAALALTVINRGFRIKASGHACSCVLPYLILSYFSGGIVVTVCLVLYLIEFWASVYLKRHTISEFLTGSGVAAVGFGFTGLLFGFY